MLDARNFFDRTHNSSAGFRQQPIVCIYLSSVYLSFTADDEMEEKTTPFSLPHMNLVQIPNCVKCLLKMDQQYTGIELPGKRLSV